MIQFDNIYIEFYVIILILAVIFYLCNNIKVHKLISIIIIILISVWIYIYIYKLSVDKENGLHSIEQKLDNDITERNSTNENIFLINKFPKKVRFLKENKELMEIISNLRFTMKFSKTRYTDIILNANKLMKVYIYILSDRYDAVHHIPIFINIRDNIIELMYSLFMIVPSTLKHTYGLDPHTQIYRSIYDFMELSRKMLVILEKFAIIHTGAVYVPDNKYKTVDETSFFP